MPPSPPTGRHLLAILAVVLASASPAQALDPDSCVGRAAPAAVPNVGTSHPGGSTNVHVHAVEETCRRSNFNNPLPTPACADGLDDDADGAPDYPADPGCEGPLDASELPECSDGIDNDQDAMTDLHDPGCEGPDDPSETTCGPANPQACGSLGSTAGFACPASPLPPLLVEADWEDDDGILVEWSPALVEPTAYLIYRVESEGANLESATEPLAAVNGAVTSYFDDQVSPGLTYVYWVTSASAGCESPPSTPALVRPGPDTADCLDLNIDRNAVPPIDPEYKGTGCLPL